MHQHHNNQSLHMKEGSNLFFEKPSEHAMASRKVSSRHSKDVSSRNEGARVGSEAPMSPSPPAPSPPLAVEINVNQFNVPVQ